MARGGDREIAKINSATIAMNLMTTLKATREREFGPQRQIVSASAYSQHLHPGTRASIRPTIGGDLIPMHSASPAELSSYALACVKCAIRRASSRNHRLVPARRC